MVKVSIIIAYKNNIKYIFQTLRSILNQKKFSDYEVLIIYDDTDHKDLMKINKFIKNKKKFKVLINNKNIGAGLSRNVGISKSKGEYICFLDSDDYWSTNKLCIQYNFMKKNRLIFSHTKYRIISERNNIIGLSRSRTIRNFDELKKSCDIGLSTVMIKRNFLIKNNLKFPKIKTKEDFVLWLRVAKKFDKNNMFNCIDTPLSYYRKSPNSLSGSIATKLLNGYLVYRKYLKYSFFKSIYSLFIMSYHFLKK